LRDHDVRIRIKEGHDLGQVELVRNDSYPVFAIEFTNEHPIPLFWVVGDEFNERTAAGIVRPDLVAADCCVITEPTIPVDWITVAHVYGPGWRLITGPKAFTERGFLERLLDGDPAAATAFKHAVETAG
jgi:hypothetical protein